MSVKKDYTTEQKLEDYIDGTIPTSEAEAAINAAIDIVDNITGRNFEADDSATPRKYDGNNKDTLNIDDCVEVTKVELGNNYYGDSHTDISKGGSAGYYLLPNNYDSRDVPIRQVHLRARHWIEGLQNHIITAKWGYSKEAPDDIVAATNIIAAGIYNYKANGAQGNIKREKIGGYSVSYDTKDGWSDLSNAKEILNSYVRYSL